MQYLHFISFIYLFSWSLVIGQQDQHLCLAGGGGVLALCGGAGGQLLCPLVAYLQEGAV